MSGEPNPFRDLPAVDQILIKMEGRLPRALLADVARLTLEQARASIASGRAVDIWEELEQAVTNHRRNSAVPLVNASGVLLHTNLGRATWSVAARAKALTVMSGPANLEIDLASGARSRRAGYAVELLRVLTGAEDALIVNNNAAAVLVILAALAGGKAVPVSRGELIEIGGAYRLPEVIATSGAVMIEVGTTNRTRLGDYETALQVHDCGAVLKVHPSNFQITGFTTQVTLTQLAALLADTDVPLIYDIGSGLLDSRAKWLPDGLPPWLADEPAARESIGSGASLVSFSGDKLLGGPQAGIVVGERELVETVRSHPLARALRVDSVTLAGLEATLEAYADGDASQIPFWAMATTPGETIRERAQHVADELDAEVREGWTEVGAGSAPGSRIPTWLVWLPGEDHLHEALLALTTPILSRRREDGLMLDMRTVDPDLDDELITAVQRCRS